MPSILFVCSANQCRSPMAEVLFRQMLEERGVRGDWRVESAGVLAFHGASATQSARAVMAERNLDLESHSSQPADTALLGRFDIVIVMGEAHKATLQKLNPSLAERILTIRELVGESGEFEDPAGGSVVLHRSAADELSKLIERSLGPIQSRLAKAESSGTLDSDPTAR